MRQKALQTVGLLARGPGPPGHHDYIAKPADRYVDNTALLLSLEALGSPLEQHPAIDIIRQKRRLLRGYPRCVGDLGQLRIDLRPELPPPTTSTRFPWKASGD